MNLKESSNFLKERENLQFKRHEAMRKALLNKIINIDIWYKYHLIKNVYLFGSILEPGFFIKKSDIDIAVEGNITAKEYFDLWRKVEEIIDWEVDLKQINTNSFLYSKIKTNGMKIYEGKDNSIKK